MKMAGKKTPPTHKSPPRTSQPSSQTSTNHGKPTVLKNILRMITDFTNGIKNNAHQSPDTGVDLLSWVLEDDDLRPGVEKKHSKLNEVGWFLGGSPADVKTGLERLKDVSFEEWYADSWWHELIFKNSFTEYGTAGKSTKGKIESLNLIKVDEVEIVNTVKGKVLSYLQIPTNPDGKANQIVTLPPDKVFHCKFDKITTSLWGISSLRTLIPTLNKKRLLEDFIGWLIESNQFRSVIKIPSGVAEGDVETYLEMLKNGMLNPTNFLVVQGDEAEVTALRTFEGFVELLKLLEYYQAKINKNLQLPPLEAGNVESSNRSSSEYQVRYAYYSHIKYLLKRKAHQINNDLFKRLEIKNVVFIPKLVDDQSRKDLIESGQQLLGMNANNKKLNKWLINEGLNIPEDLLEEPEVVDLAAGKPQDPSNIQNKGKPAQNGSKLNLDKNSPLHPSRKKTQQNFAGGSRKS